VLKPVCSFILVILLLLINPDRTLAQVDSLLSIWAEFAEDESEFLEIIQDLIEQPVNINTANRNELLRIPFLNEALADSIISLRNRKGLYTSKRQLSPVLGSDLYQLTRDFFTIRSRRESKGYFTHRNYYRIDKTDEMKRGIYQGNNLYDYNKLLYQLPYSMRMGIVTQKDMGEQSLVDYYGGFWEYNQPRWKIILGSFYCHFGQGITFSNAFGQQKSSMAVQPFRNMKNGAFANLSSAENTALFGLAAEIQPIRNTQFYVFYSQAYRDAQWNRDNKIIGLDYSGYHRTVSEINRKHNIRENTMGLAIERNFGQALQVGGLLSRISFEPGLTYSLETVSEAMLRRQLHKFSGNTLTQYSLYYQFNWKAMDWSAEYSDSREGGAAFIQSLYFKGDAIALGMKYWYISKDFLSAYGRTFSNSNPFPQAEEGFYLGMRLKPQRSFTVNLYRYFRKDLWRTYFNKMPLTRSETLLEVEYSRTGMTLSARLRKKENEVLPTVSTGNSTDRITSNQYLTRLQVDYRLSPSFRFRTRWDWTHLEVPKEQGTYLYEDISYTLNKNIWLNSRIVLFRTDSYNSRLYEYESDLPGSFANYAVFGEGYIWYVLSRWSFWQRYSIWFKYRYQLSQKSAQSFDWASRYKLDRLIRVQLSIQL